MEEGGFDGERYQRLCEQALAELDDRGGVLAVDGSMAGYIHKQN